MKKPAKTALITGAFLCLEQAGYLTGMELKFRFLSGREYGFSVTLYHSHTGHAVI